MFYQPVQVLYSSYSTRDLVLEELLQIQSRPVGEPHLAYPGQLAEARHCGNLNSQLGHATRRDGLQIDGFILASCQPASVMQYGHVLRARHHAGYFSNKLLQDRPRNALPRSFEILSRNQFNCNLFNFCT